MEPITTNSIYDHSVRFFAGQYIDANRDGIIIEAEVSAYASQYKLVEQDIVNGLTREVPDLTFWCEKIFFNSVKDTYNSWPALMGRPDVVMGLSFIEALVEEGYDYAFFERKMGVPLVNELVDSFYSGAETTAGTYGGVILGSVFEVYGTLDMVAGLLFGQNTAEESAHKLIQYLTSPD